MANTCTICQKKLGRTVLSILSPDRFEISVGINGNNYIREWVLCENCKCLTNILPIDSLNKVDSLRRNYYEVDFSGGNVRDKYLSVMSLHPDKSDNVGRVNRVFEFSKSWFPSTIFENLKVLDIGAGTGVFLSKLSDASDQYSWEFKGIEPDPKAAKHLRELGKFEVYEGLFQGQYNFKGFHLITLNKVLEHIEKPLNLLSDIRKIMCGTSSLLYVEVPDKITAEIRMPNDNILGALHCHLYDFQTIMYFADKLNFELLKVQRIKEPSGKLTIFAFLTLPDNIRIS